jgi:hypothetical protein
MHGNTRHGRSKTPEYRIWAGILQRCYNPRVKSYQRYGGIGVGVCDRWREHNCGFENFLADVGMRPSPLHSIDRFPNHKGNYEPGNVRWATQTEQVRNTSVNVLLTYNEHTACLAEWAEITGLHYLTITKRIKRGWSVDRSLSTPVGRESKYRDRPNSRKITFNGRTQLLSEWAIEIGISKQSLRFRIKHWGIERALQTKGSKST